MSYKKTKHQLVDQTWVENPNMILRISDGAYIPTSTENTDYQKYLEWVAEGNTAEAAD
jgi:hypothetical protein